MTASRITYLETYKTIRNIKFHFQFHRICSRWPPSLCKQRRILFWKLRMTLLQRSLSLFILWMCCVIESFSSWSDSGTSLYTTSFRWPQRKKSRGFRSGEYGAQTKLVFKLITRSWKFLASQWLAMSCPRRRRHICMYLSQVTDWQFPSLSSKKDGPMIPWLLLAAQTVPFFECNFSQILDFTRCCIFY